MNHDNLLLLDLATTLLPRITRAAIGILQLDFLCSHAGRKPSLNTTHVNSLLVTPLLSFKDLEMA